VEVARGEDREERTKLSAQLETARAQLVQEWAVEAGLKEDLARANQQLLSESRHRAAAESQAAQVPRLETKIQELEGRLAATSETAANLKARAAQLATELQTERSQAAEKLGLLQDARRELADTFKALAGDSLSANTESFLALAQASFSRIQE